MRECNKAKYI